MHNLPNILLEGKNWFVINKPEGLAVHPGPATPDSLEQILPLYAPSRPVPQPVHRLDRDTSGCLLVAKRQSALRELGRQFEQHQVHKTYWALITNPPAANSGLVDAPLEKISSREAGWRMVPSAKGKSAQTRWEILARAENTALVAFHPQTGRTHQIRVHSNCMAPGCAIIGDPVYGQAHPLGMMLHARSLGFTDPATQTEMRAEAPTPTRFQACMPDLMAIYEQVSKEI